MTDPSATTLPPEAIELAGRMYDAARSGDATVFAQALPAGLPVNMTNEKGDSLVGGTIIPFAPLFFEAPPKHCIGR